MACITYAQYTCCYRFKHCSYVHAYFHVRCEDDFHGFAREGESDIVVPKVMSGPRLSELFCI